MGYNNVDTICSFSTSKTEPCRVSDFSLVHTVNIDV